MESIPTNPNPECDATRMPPSPFEFHSSIEAPRFTVITLQPHKLDTERQASGISMKVTQDVTTPRSLRVDTLQSCYGLPTRLCVELLGQLDRQAQQLDSANRPESRKRKAACDGNIDKSVSNPVDGQVHERGRHKEPRKSYLSGSNPAAGEVQIEHGMTQISK